MSQREQLTEAIKKNIDNEQLSDLGFRQWVRTMLIRASDIEYEPSRKSLPSMARARGKTDGPMDQRVYRGICEVLDPIVDMAILDEEIDDRSTNRLLIMKEQLLETLARLATESERQQSCGGQIGVMIKSAIKQFELHYNTMAEVIYYRHDTPWSRHFLSVVDSDMTFERCRLLQIEQARDKASFAITDEEGSERILAIDMLSGPGHVPVTAIRFADQDKAVPLEAFIPEG